MVPGEAVDAQSLIAYSDLVISAGGTMNREAVALGDVPLGEPILLDRPLAQVRDLGKVGFLHEVGVHGGS